MNRFSLSIFVDQEPRRWPGFVDWIKNNSKSDGDLVVLGFQEDQALGARARNLMTCAECPNLDRAEAEYLHKATCFANGKPVEENAAIGCPVKRFSIRGKASNKVTQAVPRSEWPATALEIAAHAIESDTGVGSVADRLSKAGDDSMKAMAIQLAKECPSDCWGNRVGWLNRKYPLVG